MAIASVLPVLFFAAAPSPLPFNPLPSVRKCQQPLYLVASDENLEAFSKWRRQWSSPMLDADHPAIAPLTPTTFDGRIPDLTTKLEIEDCGLHRLLLQWNSNQLGHGEEMVPVGSMEFHIDTPCKEIGGLEDALSMKCAELKNIDILRPFRGHRGTELLMHEMIKLVDVSDSRYVMLRHLDRGSGKLVQYYQKFGFADARSALPPVETVQKLLDRDHMIVAVEELRERTAEMVAQIEQPTPQGNIATGVPSGAAPKRRLVVNRTAPSATQQEDEPTTQDSGPRSVTLRTAQKKPRMVVRKPLHPLPY